jgi:hypothetical protein
MALLVKNQTLVEELYNNINESETSSSPPSSPETDQILFLDPSEHFRPEHKSAEEYRIYKLDQVC